jgi:hypothetical protein
MSSATLWSVAARAQEPDSVPAGEAAAEPAEVERPNLLETLLPGVKISGYVESSFTVSTADSTDPAGVVVGRTFDRFDDEFMLNAFKLALEKPADPEALSAGFRVDLLFGQNATVVQSAGLHLGDQGDVEQAYVTLNVPVAKGLTFKAGKWVTLMGVEVIEDVVNPTWSEGNQFLFAENFTGTGIETGMKFSDYADAELRVYNGWDVVDDNNDDVSFMGRLGITPDAATTIGIVGFIGPEQPDDDEADRKGVNVVVYRAVTDAVRLWGQFDYGTEDANPALPDPTDDARWWAAAVWAAIDVSPRVGIGLRGDYFDDMDGARTSGAPFTAPFPANPENKFGNVTLTLNVKAWENALVRPEIRYDKSSVDNAFGDDDSQVTFSLSAAFLY